MKIGILPYQPQDIVHGNSNKLSRPHWPVTQETHEILNGAQKFEKPEDIPLNRRHFVYRPCGANPLFTELGYCCTEYPIKRPGINLMDRSDGISVAKGDNCCVSVAKSMGWRTARSDVCIKEGLTYWEVEVVLGGAPMDFAEADSLQRRKELLNETPHLRLGISKREASLESPVGFDSYGYGVRDSSLESIHEGKVTQVLNTQVLKPGDRIGFLLQLPSAQRQIQQAEEYTKRRLDALTQSIQNSSHEYEHVKKRAKTTNKDFQIALLKDVDHTNVVRDHIAIRYKNQLFFEATDYIKTTKPEYYSGDKRERQDYYRLEDSFLAVYLNGQPLGDAFRDLNPFLPPFSELQYNEKFYFGYWKNGIPTEDPHQHSKRTGLLLRNKYVNNSKLGYYPTVSCFNGGTARLIATKEDCKYYEHLKKPAKLLDELFAEQIAEDIVWDIIDEIEEEFSEEKRGQ
ncbi:related to COMPASS component BRE2 [Zygosaccharomyces bailii]|nr:related to COMPASS component BRE2 [Zygosaccharomyces bailii]